MIAFERVPAVRQPARCHPDRPPSHLHHLLHNHGYGFYQTHSNHRLRRRHPDRPRNCGRRHVDIRSSPDGSHPAAIWIHRHDRLARSSAPLERAIQRRRLWIVRIRRRARPDEPSRGARPASKALDGAEKLRRGRLRRAVTQRRDEGHRPRAERPDVVRRRHPARRRGRAACQRHAGRARRPQGRNRGDRERKPRSDRPALRRRHLHQGAHRLYRYKSYTDATGVRARTGVRRRSTTSPIRATT